MCVLDICLQDLGFANEHVRELMIGAILEKSCVKQD